MKASLGYYLKIPVELKYLKPVYQMVKLLILAEEQKIRVRLALLVATLLLLPAAQAPAAAQAAVQALAVQVLAAALLAVVLLAQAQVVSLALFSHQDVILLIISLMQIGMVLVMEMSQALELMVAALLMGHMINLVM